MSGKSKQDPASGITGGLILILLGVLFLLVTTDNLDWEDWWVYLLIGIGAIFVLEVIVRAFLPGYQRFNTGKLIAGVVLIIIGATNIYGITRWWPLIVIGIGVIVIFTSFRKI